MPCKQIAMDNKQIILIKKLADNTDINCQPRWRIIDMSADIETIMNVSDIIEFFSYADAQFVLDIIEELLSLTPEINTLVGSGRWVAKRIP